MHACCTDNSRFIVRNL